MRRVWGWSAGLALSALLAAGCGLEERRADEGLPEYSAERLDFPEQDSVLDLLEPEEREAVDRARLSGARPEHVSREPEKDSAADTAGKASISLLGVALTLAAVAAPFFLF